MSGRLMADAKGIDLGTGAYPGVYVLAWPRAPLGRVHERRGDDVHTHARAEF